MLTEDSPSNWKEIPRPARKRNEFAVRVDPGVLERRRRNAFALAFALVANVSFLMFMLLGAEHQVSRVEPDNEEHIRVQLFRKPTATSLTTRSSESKNAAIAEPPRGPRSRDVPATIRQLSDASSIAPAVKGGEKAIVTPPADQRKFAPDAPSPDALRAATALFRHLRACSGQGPRDVDDRRDCLTEVAGKDGNAKISNDQLSVVFGADRAQEQAVTASRLDRSLLPAAGSSARYGCIWAADGRHCGVY